MTDIGPPTTSRPGDGVTKRVVWQNMGSCHQNRVLFDLMKAHCKSVTIDRRT